MSLATEFGFDFVSVEMATSSSGPWTDIASAGWTGDTGLCFFLFTEDAVGVRRNQATSSSASGCRATATARPTAPDRGHRAQVRRRPGADGQLRRSSTAPRWPRRMWPASRRSCCSKNWQLTTARRTAILLNRRHDARLRRQGRDRGSRQRRRRAHRGQAARSREPNTTIIGLSRNGDEGDDQVQVERGRLDSSSASSTAARGRPCSSPKTYMNLAHRSHTIRVRAIDKVGNVDASPAAKTFNSRSGAPHGR